MSNLKIVFALPLAALLTAAGPSDTGSSGSSMGSGGSSGSSGSMGSGSSDAGSGGSNAGSGAMGSGGSSETMGSSPEKGSSAGSAGSSDSGSSAMGSGSGSATGPGEKAHPGDEWLKGKVSKVSKSEITITPKGGETKTLKIAKETVVTINGKDAKPSQIKQGQHVRAAYANQDGEEVATKIEVGKMRQGQHSGSHMKGHGGSSGSSGSDTGSSGMGGAGMGGSSEKSDSSGSESK